MTRGEIEREFAALARTMYFSKETVASFKSSASRGQLVAVCELIADEQRVREENRKARLLRQARFPAVKSVDDYDFSEVSFPEGYTKDDLVGLGFLELAQDFVFYGGCGRGKTHLATAVGLLATQAGYRVRYFETAVLVLMLKAAAADGKLEQVLKDVHKADLLIIDEFGYLPVDVEGARLLYQVMAATYESRSMIVTTNIEFSRWGTVLGDDKLATAVVDRIVHHGRLVEFGGNSRRFDEALMMGKSEK
ncbi:MAG: ATP-binding protein [Coriobacteriaceae bacterium]|nr:ATP-binding protein [Coriobacteriaceae bacterium]